jgi:SWI/SNF-related matrix-associated actin-dependent regulator of chromatin subfamily A member 5
MSLVQQHRLVRPGLTFNPVTRAWAPRIPGEYAREALRVAAEHAGEPAAAAAADPDMSSDESDEDAGAAGPSQPAARRSGRAVRSRLVSVNGHDVLRLNTYSLAAGEPSVFDAELRAGGARPSDDFDAAGARKRRRCAEEGQARSAAAARRAAARKAARAARGPNKLSPAVAAKLAHNAAVAATRVALLPRRDAFLAKHMHLLAPFLAPAVIERLRAAPPLASLPRVAPPPAAPPPQVTATLRPYQLAGFRFLAERHADGLSPILGDEMGLGKTLQTICLLAHVTFGADGRRAPAGGPHLVVCPLSVLPSWLAELRRWCPALRVLRVHANSAAECARLRAGPLRDPSSFDVAVTTYEVIKGAALSHALCSSICWRVLVLDEAQRANNEEAQVSAALRRVRRASTVLLSGTLLQNDLHELWALLNLLYRDIFTDATPFDDAFQLHATGRRVDSAALARAHAMLNLLCLRREKATVERTLPPKVETCVTVPLAPAQAALYKALLLRHASVIDAHTAAGVAAAGRSVGDMRVLQYLVMQLRLVCDHPSLLARTRDEEAPEPTPAELVAASGKLCVLERLLERLHAGGHRVVIFTQFGGMLDILATFARHKGYGFARLDGNVSRVRRTVDMLRVRSGAFAFLRCRQCAFLVLTLRPVRSLTVLAARCFCSSPPRVPAGWASTCRARTRSFCSTLTGTRRRTRKPWRACIASGRPRRSACCAW